MSNLLLDCLAVPLQVSEQRFDEALLLTEPVEDGS